LVQQDRRANAGIAIEHIARVEFEGFLEGKGNRSIFRVQPFPRSILEYLPKDCYRRARNCRWTRPRSRDRELAVTSSPGVSLLLPDKAVSNEDYNPTVRFLQLVRAVENGEVLEYSTIGDAAVGVPRQIPGRRRRSLACPTNSGSGSRGLTTEGTRQYSFIAALLIVFTAASRGFIPIPDDVRQRHEKDHERIEETAMSNSGDGFPALYEFSTEARHCLRNAECFLVGRNPAAI